MVKTIAPKDGQNNPNSLELAILATKDNFDEEAYLIGNPDVRRAVEKGSCSSGRQHFEIFGKFENRKLSLVSGQLLAERKLQKKQLIKNILTEKIDYDENENHLDFLTDELKEEFGVIDTNAVSNNLYDPEALNLINKYEDGLVLDCGAGSRDIYYSNVVNLEIADYPSTDVRGVGEALPFRDNSFDAVLSLAVLEHVKKPWLCANEMMRVLKPGGEIMCAVPFLSPVHGYPDHYYNMTANGLRNLFGNKIEVNRHEVPASVLPIWTLTWILNSWCDGLDEKARKQFCSMKVKDLLSDPRDYLGKPFVTSLSMEKNFELACGTVLHGVKI